MVRGESDRLNLIRATNSGNLEGPRRNKKSEKDGKPIPLLAQAFVSFLFVTFPTFGSTSVMYGVASSCLGVFVKFHSKKARAAMGAVRCVLARQSRVAGAGPNPPSEYEYGTTESEEFVGFTSLYDEFRGNNISHNSCDDTRVQPSTVIR
jgi:hypothetical protein